MREALGATLEGPSNTKGLADGADYKSSWQRWQSIPGFLEQRRQQLLQKTHQQSISDQRPTQEALDFFESLLSGTEPGQPEHVKPNTTDGAAQVQDAARRLQKQAESLRRQRLLRQGLVKNCLQHTQLTMPTQPADSQDSSKSKPLRVEKKGLEPEPRDKTFEERETSRRMEHQRKMEELEAAAALEREELLAKIRREEFDAAARRHAQQAWFEDFSKKKEKAAKEAAREAAESDGRRKRWQAPKGPNGPRGPKGFFKGPHGSDGEKRGQDKEDHTSGRPKIGARAAKPPPAPSDMQHILEELVSKQDEPLESRKRIWHQT